MRLTLDETELQHSRQELHFEVEEQAAEIFELPNRLIRLAEQENALVDDDLTILVQKGACTAQICCRVYFL
jgi:hypothetical protein